ncbi:NAD(P)/FAD-dependent oxidoreductase [Salibacterium salarium]|uniref:NAD(P)/FAD-dependent oxidoreductase n=1 Tax=Salibacterium salarium TaxID=284579 RepID=A0A428MWG2_9BACI|nr:NAD(P)/FAD-dependent oxidoreductase [Salibacterium salarium]RSL30434.1 NAD(P)/FAD-dependent oxidoreductase [Salibacterium salarium]
MKEWDVVVIGGGPAGLNAALVLGRSLRQTMIIDAGTPRNNVTQSSHGFLTRDGINPRDFREIAVNQLKTYHTITKQKDVVIDVSKQNGSFKIKTQTGAVFLSKKVIVATGQIEEIPEIKGLREVFGTSVFVCPYCDGWERKGEQLAVFGSGENILHFAALISNWSKDLVVFTNGRPMNIKDKEELNYHHIKVVEGPILECKSKNGKLQSVQVQQQPELFYCTGGFIMGTGKKESFPLPENLGVAKNEHGEYETDGHGETSVAGLYVIGDAKHSFTGLVCAAGEGYEAGVKINQALVDEEWAQGGSI